ncbi:hypothetical protein [Dethiothermospora halolimnae]|uniref:hypothetical protein n=1 Tax=Dethiothermospora halolimnae TaxID=3114390 RepID=UPI003CCC2DC7
MELLCPVCNGLEEPQIVCKVCNSAMEDKGPLVDYLDDYSPYLSNDITQQVDGVAHDKCVHIYKCQNCGKDKRVIINRVKV